MRRFLTVITALLCAAPALAQQSSPGFVTGQIPTAAQWNSYFAGKLDYNAGGLPLSLGGTGSTTAPGALTNLGAMPNTGAAVAAALGYTPLSPTSNGGSLSVTPSGGTTSSTLANLFAEVVDATAYGVVSDPACTVDNTAAIRAALTAAGGKKLVFPSGTFCLNSASSTLVVANAMDIAGQGASTIFKWNAPNGSAIAPIFDVTAANVTMHDLAFNANADVGGYVDPTYWGTNPWGGVALAIEGDGFAGYNLFGSNAFDNCIGISKLTSNVAVAGSPKKVTLNNIQTTGCGVGVHVHGGPGKKGAGIDNGSGQGVAISNAVDTSSYLGFISDLGASAIGSWTNIVSVTPQVDGSNPTNGSGYGLYNGAPHSSFTNVTVISPGVSGIWQDQPALNGVFSNVEVKAAQQNCLRLKGPATFSGLNCVDSSQAGSNLYSDIEIDSSTAAISPLQINGLFVSGTLHAYSVHATGANTINGLIQSGTLTGVSAATSLAGTASGLSFIATGANGVGFGLPIAAYPWDFTGTTRIQGHVLLGGSTPVVSACGTGPSNFGADAAGKVHEGTTATGCTITFATAYAQVPYCAVTPLAPLTSFTYTVSASAITITHGSASSADIDYVCAGAFNG